VLTQIHILYTVIKTIKYSLWVVQTRKINPRWQTDAILKNKKSPYLGNGLPTGIKFGTVTHTDPLNGFLFVKVEILTAHRQLKFQNFTNKNPKNAAIFKNKKWLYLRSDMKFSMVTLVHSDPHKKFKVY